MRDSSTERLIERRRLAAEQFPLMTIKDVGKQYGVSVRTLRRWQAAGWMPEQVKHGRHLKYRKEDIAKLMTAKKVDRDDAIRSNSGS